MIAAKLKMENQASKLKGFAAFWVAVITVDLALAKARSQNYKQLKKHFIPSGYGNFSEAARL